ncbi:GNAT family N-acetyltransferase [Mucilaginibacter sp. ZT4R22]|uniref:GNAT family N-acetyltransferase n=1 Tax=Mucilaginibacter pankratovii TaxID=2772110 RepID=A0ABR7WST3_9SPHI|nr:GNAT family N-acetyltransferase [Mucilaginibacter pankratovii]MBD1365363.1 GNAT family N-acetyltransferase [Mucilaginibacter pankratovii]
MDELKLIFDPTKEHLAQIESWLIEEDMNNKNGFYCTWIIIVDYFEKNRIGVLLLNDWAIGFITWSESTKMARIEIAEVHPGHRKKSYGGFMLKSLVEALKPKGIAVLDLHCQPASSEKVWKKLGFKKFPDVPGFDKENSLKDPHLYRIIVAHLKPAKAPTSKNLLILWSVEPYQADREQPRWVWDVTFHPNSSRLTFPIIIPAKRDWNLRWAIDGKTVTENKIKKFGQNEIDFGDFLVIESL